MISVISNPCWSWKDPLRLYFRNKHIQKLTNRTIAGHLGHPTWMSADVLRLKITSNCLVKAQNPDSILVFIVNIVNWKIWIINQGQRKHHSHFWFSITIFTRYNRHFHLFRQSTNHQVLTTSDATTRFGPIIKLIIITGFRNALFVITYSSNTFILLEFLKPHRAK